MITKAAVIIGGMAIAALAGAGPASALGFGVNGNDFGDVSTGESGNASGNTTIAVSILGPASATASGNAKNNTLIAIDGVSAASGNAEGNVLITDAGASYATGNAKGNTIINESSVVVASGNASGVSNLSLCGTSFTGQAAHVTVSKDPDGIC